ncbi:MAG TPA: NUDIX domain-containing protein, partial [Clostridiaceae bacterium]|nr:NUDIX domain-containing protein [Clostridiaceae bacterium]
MLVKNYAGSLVFWGDKVFLLKDERGQWVFPNGVIQKDELSVEAALRVVKGTAGITAEIVSTEGHVSYEISSKIRQNPIYNKTVWYVMITQNDKYKIKEEKGYKNGGYYSIQEAMELLTYNNKAILNFLSKRLSEIVEEYNERHNVEYNSDDVNNDTNDKVKIYRNIE